MGEKTTLYLNISEALKICEHIIDELGWRLEKIEGNTIVASTGFSLRSWGEIITIHLKRTNNNETEVYVESKPNTQVFDWGKSKENEQVFIRRLNKIGGSGI